MLLPHAPFDENFSGLAGKAVARRHADPASLPGHTYVTAPGSALLFPSPCYAVGGIPAPEAQTPDPTFSRLVRRPGSDDAQTPQARTQDRAQRVATERRHTQMTRETHRKHWKETYFGLNHGVGDGEPPPFWRRSKLDS